MAQGKLTAEQNEQYFSIRLDPYKLHHSKGMEHRAVCPLHGGGNPSQFWVNVAEGNWCCFSCGEKGGSAFSLEMKMLASELNRPPMADEVSAKLEELLGVPFKRRVHPDAPAARDGRQFPWDRRQAQDKYVYTDEIGNEQFTVWRFVFRNGSKITPVDRPCDCHLNPEAECPNACYAERVGNMNGVRRVLYRLPDVMQSILCFIVEGEKNVKDLSRALSEYIRKRGHFPLGGLHVDRVAVTTNQGGAAGWKKEYGYGKHFFRKVVIKLGDNDGPGRLHDQAVCADVARYARELFTLELPVGEGEDISDYLERNTIEDFLKLLPNRKEYRTSMPADSRFTAQLEHRKVLEEVENLQGDSTQVDWLVEGIIERGSRGLIVAPPKTGKSLFFLEVAICLASNIGFLGKRAYGRRVKCAVISREDGPVIVKRRIRQLAAGHHLHLADLRHHLLVNSVQQTERFLVDRDEDVTEMAEWLKSHGIEFVVVDVLNRLHTKQENSSDEMTKVMQQFDRLAALSGAQVCVIHHTNKGGGVKGSTSIEGWADYVFSLDKFEGTEDVKVLSVRTKSSVAVQPRTMRYWQSDDEMVSRIVPVQARA